MFRDSRKVKKPMTTVTHLAEIRKDKLDALANMLAHARIFVPSDLALDTDWRSKTHSAIQAAANEGGFGWGGPRPTERSAG
jgi:hypothetical protein